MKPKSVREKWLLASLPAVLTLLIGWALFFRPTDLVALRKHVESQGPLSAKQALITRAQAESMALQKSITARKAALATETATFDRNRAMEVVSELCATHGLSLDAAKLETTGKLPTALQDATPALTHNPAATPPQVWRIELSGAYANVVKLLAGLQQSQPLIVPLSLSMDTRKKEKEKERHQPLKWVLTLWL